MPLQISKCPVRVSMRQAVPEVGAANCHRPSGTSAAFNDAVADAPISALIAIHKAPINPRGMILVSVPMLPAQKRETAIMPQNDRNAERSDNAGAGIPAGK